MTFVPAEADRNIKSVAEKANKGVPLGKEMKIYEKTA